MVIDAWVVPNPPDIARLWPDHLAHVFKLFKREEALAGATPEELVAEMDEAGVDIAILTGVVEESFVIGNEVTAAFVEAAPTRFRGRACVDPRAPAEAVRELERCVRDYGFGSLQVLPYAFGLPFSHRLYYPLFSKCVELGIPVVTQAGHTASILPSDPGRPLYIDEVALDFPELVVVAGHIGWPWTEEMIALAWKHPNVYIETSGHTPRRYPAAFVDFLKGLGKEKCLFGTDWPWLRFDRSLEQVKALELDPETERKFLGGTAAQVFSITAE
jgi:predicted TIM-barrel fold metal-dependent hydrolase